MKTIAIIAAGLFLTLAGCSLRAAPEIKGMGADLRPSTGVTARAGRDVHTTTVNLVGQDVLAGSAGIGLLLTFGWVYAGLRQRRAGRLLDVCLSGLEKTGHDSEAKYLVSQEAYNRELWAALDRVVQKRFLGNKLRRLHQETDHAA